MSARPTRATLVLALLAAAATACTGDGPAAPGDTTDAVKTLLVDVAPRGGSFGVGFGALPTATFDRPVDESMKAFVELHEGDINGPVVAGAWQWIEEDTRIRFTPEGSLEPGTPYVIHLGGGLVDANGERVDLEENGFDLGGATVTDGRLEATEGGTDPADHTGENWDHPSDGSHGMSFGFTTVG